MIPNKVLYDRCEAESIGFTLRRLRWNLFGHVLRLNVIILQHKLLWITTVTVIINKNLEDDYLLFFFMNIMCNVLKFDIRTKTKSCLNRSGNIVNDSLSKAVCEINE